MPGHCAGTASGESGRRQAVVTGGMPLRPQAVIQWREAAIQWREATQISIPGRARQRRRMLKSEPAACMACMHGTTSHREIYSAQSLEEMRTTCSSGNAAARRKPHACVALPPIVRPGTKGIVSGAYEGATTSGGAYEAPTKAFSNGKTLIPAAAQCGDKEQHVMQNQRIQPGRSTNDIQSRR